MSSKLIFQRLFNLCEGGREGRRELGEEGM